MKVFNAFQITLALVVAPSGILWLANQGVPAVVGVVACISFFTLFGWAWTLILTGLEEM